MVEYMKPFTFPITHSDVVLEILKRSKELATERGADTEQNVFSSLGKLIEQSGGPYILGESCVISIGSINRFLKGKMFSRCRCGHLLLSGALRRLHLKKNIVDVNVGSSIMTELTEWSDKDDTKPSALLLNFVKNVNR